MQTKPLAVYVGAACFVMAGVAGATWASFRNTKVDEPLFLQSGEITSPAPGVDWQAPSQSPSGAGSVAYLNEWMALVAPVMLRDPAASASQQDNAAAPPQEVVREVPDETAKAKRPNTKAASQRRRHERDVEDTDGERIQTTGQGSAASERSGERDRRAHRNRRAHENRYERDDEDGDHTVGQRYRREPPEVRVVPEEPVQRGGGLFGIFEPFHNGW